MSSAAEQAWESLVHVYAQLEPRVAKEVRNASGMSTAAFDVLRELVSLEPSPNMNELAARIVLSRSQVSRLVDELQAAGLVKREPKPGDKRSSFVSLTPEGRRAFNKAAPAYQATISREVEGTATTEQLREVARILDAIWQAAGPTANRKVHS